MTTIQFYSASVIGNMCLEALLTIIDNSWHNRDQGHAKMITRARERTQLMIANATSNKSVLMFFLTKGGYNFR